MYNQGRDLALTKNMLTQKQIAPLRVVKTQKFDLVVKYRKVGYATEMGVAP